MKRWLLYWWQRRTRGWDDSDLWNLDYSLAKLILPRLKKFGQSPWGIPGDLTEEEWNANIQAMIKSFEIIASDNYWDHTPEQNAEIQRGLDLFAKWYMALWT